VRIDIATGLTTGEFAYQTDKVDPTDATKTIKTTVSDIVAVNNHVFLVDERDGSGLGFPRDGSQAKFKRLYLIDLDGATDVTNLTPTSTPKLKARTVKKYLFLDVLNGLLPIFGNDPGQVPAKLEGITFGDDVVVDGVTKHTVYVANDNDFDPSDENPNRWFVF